MAVVLLKALFSRRWWLVTLVVIGIVVGLARLGIWQLHRRTEKILLNQQMAERWRQTPFDLNLEALPGDLTSLAYRRIQATGKFDYDHQILIKGVNHNELPGANLVTPLVFPDQRAVLVARGWIPIDKVSPEHWSEFDEATPTVTVTGLARESQPLPGAPQPAAGQKEWFRVDIDALQAQMPYQLLPAFVEMLREPARKVDALPIRAEEPPPFDDFMHLNYAVQWFIFAVIGAFGYLMLVRQQESRQRRLATQSPTIANGEPTQPALPTIPKNA